LRKLRGDEPAHDAHSVFVWKDGKKAYLFIVDNVELRAAKEMIEECRRDVFGSDPVFVSEIGPVIGAHVGPGLLGVGGVPPAVLD